MEGESLVPYQPPAALGLRDWLIQSASIATHRVDKVLNTLDEQEVDTVNDLLIFSKMPAFATSFAEVTCEKIRQALANHATPPAAPDLAAPSADDE